MALVKDIFVIMPFSSTASCSENEWTEIFENIFRPVIQDCGYACDRAVPKTGSLISSIIDRLRTARIVVADITDHNPNVFYELGVRHTLSKRTIVVSQRTTDIPSDLRGYWSLQYGVRPGQVAKFKKDISRLIGEIDQTPEKSDSPVSDYLERENVSLVSYIQSGNIRKLGALYTELTGIIAVLQLVTGDTMADSTRKSALNEQFLSTDCLKLFVNTQYIDLGPQVLQKAYELIRDLEHIRIGEFRRDFSFRQALEDATVLSKQIMTIRDRICRGEYQESLSHTTMAWKSYYDSDPDVPPCHHIRWYKGID